MIFFSVNTLDFPHFFGKSSVPLQLSPALSFCYLFVTWVAGIEPQMEGIKPVNLIYIKKLVSCQNKRQLIRPFQDFDCSTSKV